MNPTLRDYETLEDTHPPFRIVFPGEVATTLSFGGRVLLAKLQGCYTHGRTCTVPAPLAEVCVIFTTSILLLKSVNGEAARTVLFQAEVEGTDLYHHHPLFSEISKYTINPFRFFVYYTEV